MKSFALTPLAKNDLHEIWDYIAADNIDAADRTLESLEKSMHMLGRSPGIGHWRDELTDKRHRFVSVGSYLVIYRHDTKPVQIVRVLHASRDVQAILRLT